MNKSDILKDYWGRQVSAKTLFGLADISFFDMCHAGTDLSELGIHIDYSILKHELSQKETTEMKRLPARNFIKCDYKTLPGEDAVLAGAVNGLYGFLYSGKGKSGEMSASNRVMDLYVIFFSACLHAGNADPVFRWLNRHEWGHVADNTIASHLKRDISAMQYPYDTFYRYVAVAMITNPDAKPNSRNR